MPSLHFILALRNVHFDARSKLCTGLVQSPQGAKRADGITEGA